MKLLILLQCCVLLCKLTAGHEEGEGCRQGLGMENGKIADNQITASSERPPYKAVKARLRYKNKQGKPLGWQPNKSRGNEWLQVDLLLDKYIVTGVATQGCRKSKRVFRVTKYKLGYSNDGKEFSTNHKLYKGNKDGSTVVYHTLETPIKARYIRFQPKSWNKKICMRVELYGNIAKACDSSPCLNRGTCFQDESGEEYICKCTSGWKGDNCEQKITACDSSPCLNGGTCFQEKSGVEEYNCTCTSGWKGDNCEQKSTGYESIGCYRDTGNRAILPLEGKDSILDGAYRTRKNPIAKCAVAAMRAGYSMFAVQHSGWCAASATAPKTFDKYGKSTACGSDGEGGPWANQVYVINGYGSIG